MSLSGRRRATGRTALGAGGPRFESGRPDCINERPCNTLRVGGVFSDGIRSDTFSDTFIVLRAVRSVHLPPGTALRCRVAGTRS